MRNRKLLFNKGNRKEIIRRCLLHGVFSLDELKLENNRTIRNVLKKMEVEGYITSKKVEGIKVYRLNKYTSKRYEYIRNYPLRTHNYYKDYFSNNALRAFTDKKDVRIKRIAEAISFFEKAKINASFPDKSLAKEKIEIFPSYYSANEDAFWGNTDDKSNSRRVGVLLLDKKTVFAVFNSGKRQLKLSMGVLDRYRLIAKVSNKLSLDTIPSTFLDSAILLYDKKMPLEKYINPCNGKNLTINKRRKDLLNVDTFEYEHIYAFCYQKEGVDAFCDFISILKIPSDDPFTLDISKVLDLKALSHFIDLAKVNLDKPFTLIANIDMDFVNRLIIPKNIKVRWIK